MADHDFSGLTSRSFEHLVQAIAVAAIGPMVTVFGDGRDGGREATFDGNTFYRPATDAWSGYGIIQAKFRQRPLDTTSDGDWALKNLKKEIAEFTKLGSTRRTPDYYILATNVVLSPVGEIGFKDRLAKELRQWSETHGVRDWAIWDYDQLTTFINVHQGIRRAFAAWTMPGDVLASVLEWVEGARPDFARIATQYLQKELWRDQYARLEQGGHSQDEKIPLANVFIDLPVSDVSSEGSRPIPQRYNDGKPSRFLNNLIEQTNLRLASNGSVAGLGERERRGTRDGRLVLLGGPGQGKTTVGQYACQLFRAALLRDVDPSLLDVQTTDACEAIISSRQDTGGLPGCRRFPLRIVLSEYAAQLADKPDLSIIQQIANQLNTRANADLSATDVHKFLEQYPFLLVLDGLDEVPSSSNRDRLLASIRDFEVDIATCSMDAVLVVTTRPQGYNDDLSSKYYQHQVLTLLDPTVALTYGTQLAQVRFGGDPDRRDKVVDRLTAASQHAATSRLMQSPLQITIMVLLVDQYGHPPEERWDLFSQYYDLICRREVERDIETSHVIREYRNHIDNVHRLVGLLLQSESERSGGTDSKLSISQFRKLVDWHLREEGFVGERLTCLAESIEKAAANRLVFLVGLEEGEVGFEIRSLQEFMAAGALIDAPEALAAERLAHIASHDNWRNVFLFAAGKCFKDRTYLRSALVEICSSLNDNPEDRPSSLLLEGSRLALDLLTEGAARKSPKYAAQLTRIALRLLRSRIQAPGIALASVYTQDTIDIYRDELEDLLTTADPDYQEEGWACLTRLADIGAIDEQIWLEYVTKSPHLLLHKNYWCAANAAHHKEALVTELAKHIWDQPAWEVYEKVRHGDGERNAVRFAIFSREELWPEGLGEFLQSMIAAPPVDGSVTTTHKGVRFQFVSVSNSATGLRNLSAPATSHASWHTLAHIWNFAAHPTKATLADALDALSEAQDSSVFRYFINYCPWPLLACCAGTDSGSSTLRRLASAARSGRIGDTYDWIEWEEQWKVRPTSIEAMIEQCIVGCPWPVDTGPILPPLTLSPRPRGADKEARDFRWARMLELLDKASLLSGPLLRSRAAEIIAISHLLPMMEAPKPDGCIVGAEGFVALSKLCDLGGESGSWLAAAVLQRIRPDENADSRSAYFDLLDRVGRFYGPAIVGHIADDGLRTELLRGPSNTGLAAFLAGQAANPDRTFAAFDVHTYWELVPVALRPEVEGACLVVRARQQQITLDDVEACAEWLMKADPDILSAFHSALASSGAAQESVEQFLVAIFDRAKTLGNRTVLRGLLEELDELVDGRRSKLADSAGWRELRLPDELLRIYE